MQRLAAIILFMFESTVEHSQEKFLIVIKNGSLFDFFNAFERLMLTFCNGSKSYLISLANFQRLIEYRMQFDCICIRFSIFGYLF
jgi:hypothetical protein